MIICGIVIKARSRVWGWGRAEVCVCHVTSDTRGLEYRLRLGKFKMRNQRQENSRSNAEFIQHSTLSLKSPITLGQKESMKMRLRDLLFKFGATSL